MTPTTIWTIGHGNRPAEEFVGLLQAAGVARVVDVRAYPASRRHPHFGRAALEDSLGAAQLRYTWEGAALGGRRRPSKNSPNTALRNAAFRAYADHMTTEQFIEGASRLLDIARDERAAVMCAERLPWQCHRFLISDYLVAQGIQVVHLVGTASAQEHRLNPIARVREGALIYDGNTQLEL